MITVYLHTTLQRQTPTGAVRRFDMTLLSGSILADLLTRLEVEPEQDSILLVINGRQADPCRTLTDGDKVHLIPALSGGAPDGATPTHSLR